MKPFLDTHGRNWDNSVEVLVTGPAAFAKEAIKTFKSNDLALNGARGTLLFTGATASVRGSSRTAAFSAGKHALRALSQSLAKEFGQQNIHVAHVIVDGPILTERLDKTIAEDEDARLDPEGIATAYLYLSEQKRSNWTWELDMRPAHEKW